MEPDKKPHYVSSLVLFVLLLILLLMMLGGYFLYRTRMLEQPMAGPLATTSSQAQQDATDQKIRDAYTSLESAGVTTKGNPSLTAALETLRAVAADPASTDTEKVRALNGINYAYTQSNFDADDVYTIVFSQPPFNTYYSEALASSSDRLHPSQGDKVAAVEAALLQLNQLSNAIMPNHYAISRMEVANIFAFERAKTASTTANQALKQQYMTKVKGLVDAYDALSPLSSVTVYTPSMRLQIMFAHASAVANVGHTLSDKKYVDEGESLFKEAINLGTSYQQSLQDPTLALDQTLLARVFYAAYYWKDYKDTDPKHIEDVLAPILDVQKIQNTAFYKDYLPSHKDANVSPFTVLRAIAGKDPTLKSFLQSLGWKF